MRFARRHKFLQFFAGLTILSFTFTQAVPAWALRPEMDKAGLEEKLLASGPASTPVNLNRLSPSGALEYLEWLHSRKDPVAEVDYYNRYATRPGESECRICAMRGNVLRGVPQMLRLMLTGGYDGAGIAIKAKVNGNYHLFLIKDSGHLNAMLTDLLASFLTMLKEVVAKEYGVNVSQVSPMSDNLNIEKRMEESFELDEGFGDEVFRMKIAGRPDPILIPMEAIGHTRWATVGDASDPNNAHPFRKQIPGLKIPDGRPFEIVLAHNGNFETFKPFKAILLTMGLEFDGDTDSEVLTAVAGFMHRGQAPGTLVPLQQAIQRLLRFVKYVEDWKSLLELVESEAGNAREYHDRAIQFLRKELGSWITLPEQTDEENLIALAKRHLSDIIRRGLETPWIFDAAQQGGRQDLAKEFTREAEPVDEAVLSEILDQKERDARRKQIADNREALQRTFFDAHYSSMAIAVMNNAEDGFVMARGRTGGDLEVYVPPLKSVADRVSHLADRMEKEPVPTDGKTAKAAWLDHVKDVREQVDGLLGASTPLEAGEKRALWLGKEEIERLVDLQRELSGAYQRVEHLTDITNFAGIQQDLVRLFRQVAGFAQGVRGVRDPGKRLAASEKRAIPGVPNIARKHPEKRFREAERGEMDSYSLGMGHVFHVGSSIVPSSVWDEELKPEESLPNLLPERGMVDLASILPGKEKSRLEREVGNQVAGWHRTLEEYRRGVFRDLNYLDELRDIEEWYFVAEGTSGFLSQVAEMVGTTVPHGDITFKGMTGKEFQAFVDSGKMKYRAEKLAKNDKRIMVTFVSNTGQTETVKVAAEKLNRLNRALGASPGLDLKDRRILPSVITNVAGSAIDKEVARFDGHRHSVYTFVGYERAIPATGSLNVGVMAAGLLTTHVQAIQGAFEKEKGEFFALVDKFDQATKNLSKIMSQREDGSLKLTRKYEMLLEDVFDKFDPKQRGQLLWLAGWYVWRTGAAEARLKVEEGLREGAFDQDIITGKHGPYAILRAGAVAIMFLPSMKAFPNGYKDVLQAIRETRGRVNHSEKGGKLGKIIVLMNEQDMNDKRAAEVSELVDATVPIPDMDNPFTGFMTSMVFMQLFTLYGARERFAPLRNELRELDAQIRKSGILGKKIQVAGTDGAAETLSFGTPSALLKAFSETLTNPAEAAEKEGRILLTDLWMRDPQHFRQYRYLAQRPKWNATRAALSTTDRVLKEAVATPAFRKSKEWTGIRKRAEEGRKIIQQKLNRLAARTEAIHRALREQGIDPEKLAEEYNRIDGYSLTPSEAIRFATDEDPVVWTDWTETYMRNLAKQISGVEAGLEETGDDAKKIAGLKAYIRGKYHIYSRIRQIQAAHSDAPVAESVLEAVRLVDQDQYGQALSRFDELLERVQGIPQEDLPADTGTVIRSLEETLLGIQGAAQELVKLAQSRPTPTQKLEQLIAELVQGFKNQTGPVRMRQFGHFEDPGPPERTYVVVVGSNEPGLHIIPVQAVSTEKVINIAKAWTEDHPDNVGVSIVVADASEERLDTLGVFRRIERAIQGGWQDRLGGYLRDIKGFDETQAGWFIPLYASFRNSPQFLAGEKPRQHPGFPGRSFLIVVFPYGRPSTEQPPILGISDRVKSITAAAGREVRLEDPSLFVTTFREAPGAVRTALVYLSFKDEDLADPALKLQDHLREFVEPYIASHLEAGPAESLPPVSSAGMEQQLILGEHFEAVGVNGVRFLQSVQITQPVRLSGDFGNVTLDPTKNGTYRAETITIAKGAHLLDRARLEGPGVIEAATRVGGYAGGTPEQPFVVGEGSQVDGEGVDISRAIVKGKVDGAKVRDAVIVPFRRGDEVVPARVVGSQLNSDPQDAAPGEVRVVMGAVMGPGVKGRRFADIGPFASVNNLGEVKATTFIGATSEDNVEMPHLSYYGSTTAVAVLAKDAQEFREGVEAVLLGVLKGSVALEKGYISSSGLLHELTFEMPDGTARKVRTQRINLGAGSGTSDYGSVTGMKAGAVLSGGVFMGYNAVVKGPVRVGDRSGVDNLRQAEGTDLLAEGTVVIGFDPSNRKVVATFRADGKGGFKLGSHLSDSVETQMEQFRRQAVLAEVYEQGARQARDPFELAGWMAKLQAVRGQFDEIGGRFGKVLGEALETSVRSLQVEVEQLKGSSEESKKRKEEQVQDQAGVLLGRDDTLKELKQLQAKIHSHHQAVTSRVTPRVIYNAVQHQVLFPDIPLIRKDGRPLMDLLDNYSALQELLQKNLGLSFSEVVELIQKQAAANKVSFAQLIRGVLDVADNELPADAEFDAIVRSAGTLIMSGGNSSRLHFEVARMADETPISLVPVYDDGGNHGAWRDYTGAVTLTGDTANQRANNATLFLRQMMNERTPEKPKADTEKKKWEANETPRSLILQEISETFPIFAKRYPELRPTKEPAFIRALATLISAHRILGDAFPDLLKKKVLSKASGQNVLGMAIGIRSGYYDPAAKAVNPSALKRAALLWNRALGLGSKDGLVIPNSLQLARLYFVYDRPLGSEEIRDAAGNVQTAKLDNFSKLPAEDLFTIRLEGNDLVLQDGAGRRLTYVAALGAYVAPADAAGKSNHFEKFPGQIEQAIRARLKEVPALFIVRGEDNGGEEDSIYENASILAWGAEFPAGAPLSASSAARETYEAILSGNSPVRTVVIGPGSEGSSTAPHFWQRETVQFLRELAQRRASGQKVPRVLFLFNPSETVESYGLGVLGQVRNHERIFREMLGDSAVRFEQLIPEVLLFDHSDPWVATSAPTAGFAQAMGVSVEDADYLRILNGQAKDSKQNRRPTPADEATLAELRTRFGPENVHLGPFADVRRTVKSSRGEVKHGVRVQALVHRVFPILYPDRKDLALAERVKTEQWLYQKKHDGQNPSPQELAGFLAKVGYTLSAPEVQEFMQNGPESPIEPAGLEEPDNNAFLEGEEELPAATSVATQAGPPIQTVSQFKSAVSASVPVRLPARVSAPRALVVTDEPAALAKFFTAVSVLERPDQVPVADVLARDAAQQQRIQSGLEQLGLTNVTVHDLQTEFGGNRGEAITTLQMRHWQAGLDTLVVTALSGLEEVTRFLGIAAPEGVIRSLEAVADRSNTVWM